MKSYTHRYSQSNDQSQSRSRKRFGQLRRAAGYCLEWGSFLPLAEKQCPSSRPVCVSPPELSVCLRLPVSHTLTEFRPFREVKRRVYFYNKCHASSFLHHLSCHITFELKCLINILFGKFYFSLSLNLANTNMQEIGKNKTKLT